MKGLCFPFCNTNSVTQPDFECLASKDFKFFGLWGYNGNGDLLPWVKESIEAANS